MEIRHLQYFVEVVKEKSFTRAASRLSVTQPTISKMVKDLEDELGFPLLLRSGKEILPTDAGNTLISHAKAILQSMQAIGAAFDDLRGGHQGVLRIGLPPMIGANFFPDVIQTFHDQYPGIDLQIFEYGGKRIEEEVEQGNLHVGVVAAPVHSKSIEDVLFIKEELQVLLPITHPLANRQAITLQELREERWILFQEDFSLHEVILAACQEVGFMPKVVCRSAHWDFIVSLVATKLGIALLPRTICKSLTRQDVFAADLMNPIIPWHLRLLWRQGDALSFATKRFMAMTQAMLFNNKESDGGGFVRQGQQSHQDHDRREES